MPSGDASALRPYDALLLVSFGGPEHPDDVIPFLRNVTRGRDVPDERLREVGSHYFGFGGRSPINDQNRALVAAVEEELTSHGLELAVYWGNRNWDPFLRDVLAKMAADGIERAACLVTSAYSSYSGCRQYREDLAEAVAGVPGAPRLDKLRVYFNHPGFVEPMVDSTLGALARLPERARRDAQLVFVTHSIPVAMNQTAGPEGSAYVEQHRSVVELVVERVREETGHRHPSSLVFCSRSGPAEVPWLEPDVNDELQKLRAAGMEGAVLVPIGFVSDHMEVRYDLDTEALATAAQLGLPCERAATAGLDPRFVGMVRQLLLERSATERGESPRRPALGALPATWDRCPVHCCPNLRGARPALCGTDA